jgi:RNA polymerase sigma-70 factor (ECF subfamily)
MPDAPLAAVWYKVWANNIPLFLAACRCQRLGGMPVYWIVGSATGEWSLQENAQLHRFLAGIERRAFRIAQLATGNVDDALDLVQETMADFVRRYAGKGETDWPPLFHRVLHSRITDWHRRTLVRERMRVWFSWGDRDGEADPLENVADPRPDSPADLLLRRDLGQALEVALRQLPLRQRQAFLLRAWEGLDVAQTAKAMGCSDGSVKTHYFRAVHTLRELLGEYAP